MSGFWDFYQIVAIAGVGVCVFVTLCATAAWLMGGETSRGDVRQLVTLTLLVAVWPLTLAGLIVAALWAFAGPPWRSEA